MGKMILTTEAARIIGVSRQTIENWAERGVFKIKKMGKAHYVDEDLVTELTDFTSDIKASLAALEETKADYERQRREIRIAKHEMMYEWQNIGDCRRYKNLCVEGSRRSAFFRTVLDMLASLGSITEREAAILGCILGGEDLDKVGSDFFLTRERVRQIAEKAIRKSNDLTELKVKIDEIHEMQTTIEAQKIVIRDLQRQLKIQQDEEQAEKQRNEEEYRMILIRNDELCSKLATRLCDSGLSVRALNVLRSLGCGTVGDVAKMHKTDILKARNCGRKTLIELDDYFDTIGLSFGMDVDRIYRERIALKMG